MYSSYSRNNKLLIGSAILIFILGWFFGGNFPLKLTLTWGEATEYRD